MIPKEKAIELFNKMKGFRVKHSHSKKCALIAVDEIIEAIDFDWMEVQNLESEHRYWNAVKEELQKL